VSTARTLHLYGNMETIQQLLTDRSSLLIGSAVAAAVSVKVLSWFSTYTTDTPIEFPVDLDEQSIEIEVNTLLWNEATNKLFNFVIYVIYVIVVFVYVLNILSGSDVSLSEMAARSSLQAC